VLRDARAFAAALGGYSVFYGCFFLRSLLSGNLIAPSDSLDFGVAAYLSRPMLWTDAMFSGYPIAADPQSLTWYPMLHLFRLADLDWNLFLISAYVVASATACLFVRRLSGSALAGIFSGVVYGFSGVMLAHIVHFNQIHAAAWAPLGLYGLQLTREGVYRGGTTVTAFAFAMMWLAGHPQGPVYASYLAMAFVGGTLVLDRPPLRTSVARVTWSASGIVIGLGIAAVSILPMVELGDFSRRAGSNWELYISKALPPWQLLDLALPFAFGGFWSGGTMPVPYFGLDGPVENTGYSGLLPLALALAAPFVVSTRRREATLWLGITVVAALLCLGAATPLGTLFFYAPGYSSFRVPARHLQVVSLCLSVLSGLAFADLTRRREGWGQIGTAVLVALAGAAIAFGVFTARVPEVAALVASNAVYRAWTITWPLSLGALFIACAAAARVFGRTTAALTAFAVLLIGIQVFDLTMLHYRMPGQRLRYADIVRAEAVPRPRIRALRDELVPNGERVLASDGSRNQFLLPNLTRPWGVPAAGGTGSLGIERYLDVLGMGGPGDVYPETFSTSHRGLDLFAVRYALVPEASPLAADLARAGGRWSSIENLHYDEDDPGTYYTLFRNNRARPHAWCVPQLLRLEPFQVLGSIRSGHLPDGRGEFDPARVALAEPGVLDGWSGGEGSAEVITNAGQQRYLVRADQPCLLVLGEVFYPWWRATLDDASVEIVRVNHAMLGVPVPAGSHVVRLQLTPRSVQIGGMLTAISLLMWAGVVVFVRDRIR
jgi:hypothetical protein